MKKLKLIIGTHNHLPLGQPSFQTEKVYQESFKPLLSVLYGFPELPAVLHYSGMLLEWLEESHPEFLMLLAEMVKRRQVEVLGGGYYDPILPLIPNNDKLGQLEKLTTTLRMRFETRPRGCWLAEQVWEPALASVLRTSGMDFTFLEDSQFLLAGADEGDLHSPAIAEDQSKTIAIFPFRDFPGADDAQGKPEALLGMLQETADATGERVVSLFLDGADYAGIRSLSGVSGEDRLQGFLRMVRESSSWIEPLTPTQYLRQCQPEKKLYVPCCSSRRMAELSLPAVKRKAWMDIQGLADGNPALRQFLFGGFYRQLLNRYPESELMYAKMMYTHVLVSQVRGDKYKKKAAQNELWKGQSHHAYWYGRSGGIYSNALRKALYHSLIEAEKITRATEIFAPSIISVDYDMDNNVEYLYQGSELNAYIHLRGGTLFELDFLPAAWNYLDTMARHDESCAPRKNAVDCYPRKAFMDHFFEDGEGIDGFDAMGYRECGSFIGGLFEVIDLNRSLPEILLRKAGTVTTAAGDNPVEIEKRFVFRPRSIDVYYRVTNIGQAALHSMLGVEMNLSLASGSPDSGRIFLLDEDKKTETGRERSEIEGVRGLLVRDVLNEVSITLSSASEFLLWSLPVETLTAREGEGQDRVFQSHCFVPQWRLTLEPGESWENHMSVGFEKVHLRSGSSASSLA